MIATPERRYQMTRIRAGDYIVPANDGNTLWRVTRYQEDGLLETSEGVVVRGTFWKTARFARHLDHVDKLIAADEFLSWDNWQEWESLLPTRAAALRSALLSGQRA